MPREDYEKQVLKIRARVKQLITQGRKLKRPERVNVNMSEWTRARIRLLAAYRGVTESTAADEAIKRGLNVIEKEIITAPHPDLTEDDYWRIERAIEEQNRRIVEEIEEGISLVGGTERDQEMARKLNEHHSREESS
jgi:hypothetical protein